MTQTAKQIKATIRQSRQLLAQEEAMRIALYSEILKALLSCDAPLLKHLLREVINHGIGFETLASQIGIPSKSMHRMLSSKGNPTCANLFAILRALRVHEGIAIDVKLTVAHHQNRA